MSTKSFRVSEIFDSIQGEGPFTGTPATFVRLAYCNLHCAWCDAWYTWDHKRVDLHKETQSVTPNELAAKVAEYKSRMIVITGGEPLLWDAQLREFLEELEKTTLTWKFTQIETNGTRIPKHIEEFPSRKPWYVVSPKLSNNGADPKRKRIIPDVLAWFAFEYRSYFKFVLSRIEDLREVESLVKALDLEGDRVFLMAEGRNYAELTEKGRWVVEACKRNNWMYTDRVHIRLYGDQRAT